MWKFPHSFYSLRRQRIVIEYRYKTIRNIHFLSRKFLLLDIQWQIDPTQTNITQLNTETLFGKTNLTSKIHFRIPWHYRKLLHIQFSCRSRKRELIQLYM